VLDSAEAFLFRSGDEFPVFHQAGRGVDVIGVEAEDQQEDCSRLALAMSIGSGS
jgi:hypothetical protein